MSLKRTQPIPPALCDFASFSVVAEPDPVDAGVRVFKKTLRNVNHCAVPKTREQTHVQW